MPGDELRSAFRHCAEALIAVGLFSAVVNLLGLTGSLRRFARSYINISLAFDPTLQTFPLRLCRAASMFPNGLACLAIVSTVTTALVGPVKTSATQEAILSFLLTRFGLANGGPWRQSSHEEPLIRRI